METGSTVDAPPSPVSRPRLRTAMYCLILAGLAGVVMFWELGADALFSDEAQYALAAQSIRAPGGAWLYPSPYPPTPFHQKPPLYFWLTASTYELLGGEEFACRAWSAAAGVGAVVLTCVLGALLFTPEIGALAGLLLLSNRAFLFVHGARSGSMDALLTFLAVFGALVYALGARRGLSWWTWLVVGIAAGLASLTKPLAGVPMVALLALHALFVLRGYPLGLRLAGPLVATAALLAVAAPWYVAQAVKYDSFLPEMFGHNLLQRAVEGISDKQVRDWKFYIEQITRSSPGFVLACAAAVFALVAWSARFQARQHALLVVLGAGWVLLFSLSASKAIHYVYPAFPFIALMIASGIALLVGYAVYRYQPRPLTCGVLLAIVLAAFAFQYARILYHVIPADRSPHVPFAVYKTLKPAIQSGGARVIFCGFPENQTQWRSRVNARECYYLERMSEGALRASGPGDLATLLDARVPSLLVAWRGDDLGWLLNNESLRPRTDPRFDFAHTGYIVLGIDLHALLESEAAPGQPSSEVRRFSVTPAVVGAGRLDIRLRVEEPATPQVRCVVKLEKTSRGGPKTLYDEWIPVVNGSIQISANIEQDLWTGVSRPHEITLALRAGEPVSSAVEQVRLTMLPHIPAQPHPRR